MRLAVVLSLRLAPLDPCGRVLHSQKLEQLARSAKGRGCVRETGTERGDEEGWREGGNRADDSRNHGMANADIC